MARSDTEQRISKSGGYASGPGANGQKNIACGPCRMSRPVVVLPEQILNNNNKKREKEENVALEEVSHAFATSNSQHEDFARHALIVDDNTIDQDMRGGLLAPKL